MSCQLPVTKALAFIAACAVSCTQAQPGDAILRSPETKAALEYRFSTADQALLDEVQYACFQYFWNQVGTHAKLVKDRKKAPVSSIAAVGFQLSSLPIGVEHGWITRQQGLERARTVLRSLIERDDNKKFGVYLHYPDLNTGGRRRSRFAGRSANRRDKLEGVRYDTRQVPFDGLEAG